jgi:flagellar motor protein MotB
MKQVKAIFFALLITGALGAALFMVGTNALANTNTVPVLNSPASSSSAANPSAAAVTSSSSDPAASAQLQQTAVQYANRAAQLAQQLNTETQQLNQETQQLNQANQQLQAYNQQLQQYQQVLIALQQNGLIQVGSDGTIYLRRGRSDNNNFDSGNGTGNSVNNTTGN